MFCTHLACFESKKSESCSCPAWWTTFTFSPLHASQTPAILGFTETWKWKCCAIIFESKTARVAPALHDAPNIHFHFHFLLCMMHDPLTFSPLHAPQKPPILCFTVVFGLRPIANHHCKTSIIQLDARKEKCFTQKTFHRFPWGFLMQTLALLFLHVCAQDLCCTFKTKGTQLNCKGQFCQIYIWRWISAFAHFSEYQGEFCHIFIYMGISFTDPYFRISKAFLSNLQTLFNIIHSLAALIYCMI